MQNTDGNFGLAAYAVAQKAVDHGLHQARKYGLQLPWEMHGTPSEVRETLVMLCTSILSAGALGGDGAHLYRLAATVATTALLDEWFGRGERTSEISVALEAGWAVVGGYEGQRMQLPELLQKQVESRADSDVVEEIVRCFKVDNEAAVQKCFYDLYSDQGVCCRKNAAYFWPEKLCHDDTCIPGDIDFEGDVPPIRA